MPKNNNDYEQEGRNSRYRSARRDAKKRTPQRKGTSRPLTVRAVPREEPNLRKLAQAVLRLAQAETEAKAEQARREETPPEEPQR